MYDVSGVEIDYDTTYYEYTYEVRLTNIVEHQDGFELYEQRRISHINEEYPDTTFSYIRETDDELRNYFNQVSNNYYVELELPIVVGNTWAYYSDSLTIFQREITDINKTQNTPAGFFTDCAVVLQTVQIEDYSSEFIYSRGCGLVKRFTNWYLSSEEITLQSYNVQ